MQVGISRHSMDIGEAVFILNFFLCKLRQRDLQRGAGTGTVIAPGPAVQQAAAMLSEPSCTCFVAFFRLRDKNK